MIYLISDTHFGHHNIIKYEDRPFNGIEDMDKYMIEQWNSVIDKRDIVFHLGDFSLTNTNRSFYIFNRLKGHKFLIRGNHDQYSEHKLINRMGFIDVYDKFWVTRDILLTHYPTQTQTFFNIHGHIHSKHYKGSEWDKSSYHRNVSVELNDYKPVRLLDIVDKIVYN